MTARLQTFAEEGAAPDAAFFTAMVEECFFRPSTNSFATWGDYAGKGSMHRCGVVVDLQRPSASAAPNVVVIDSEIDWRDRFVLVAFNLVARTSSEEPVFPGGAAEATVGGAGVVSTFGYTLLGEDEGGTATDYQQAGHIVLAPYISMYAQDLNGARPGELKIEIDENANSDRYTIWLFVIAAEQTGERINLPTYAPPTDVPVPPMGRTDGQQMEPRILNALQDGTLLSQFRQGRMGIVTELISTAAGLPSESACWPLGPLGHGQPRVPLLPKVYPQSAVNWSQKIERRQNVAGGIRLVMAKDSTSGTHSNVDLGNDWRDRMILFVGSFHTIDIRPGQSNEDDVNAGSQVVVVGYTGIAATPIPISPSGDTLLYADAGDGRLRIVGQNSESGYLVGFVIGSFKLGAYET